MHAVTNRKFILRLMEISCVVNGVYSFFSSIAGLLLAAFSVCHSTVPKAKASEITIASTNIQP